VTWSRPWYYEAHLLFPSPLCQLWTTSNGCLGCGACCCGHYFEIILGGIERKLILSQRPNCYGRYYGRRKFLGHQPLCKFVAHYDLTVYYHKMPHIDTSTSSMLGSSRCSKSECLCDSYFDISHALCTHFYGLALIRDEPRNAGDDADPSLRLFAAGLQPARMASLGVLKTCFPPPMSRLGADPCPPASLECR
jgi:Fe-S-cluster containining protein